MSKSKLALTLLLTSLLLAIAGCTGVEATGGEQYRQQNGMQWCGVRWLPCD